MHTLILDSFSIQITDYLLDYDMLVIDTKFPSQKDIDEFISFLSSHGSEGISYKYQVDDMTYNGRFGNYVYDVEHNVRFYMTTTPDRDRGLSHDSVIQHNIPKMLDSHEKRISTLVNLLLEKKIITLDDASMFASPLHQITNSTLDLHHQVKCLNDYLTSSNDTIDAIRKRSNK